MASISSILNDNTDGLPWHDPSSEPTPAVNRNSFPSPPSHNPPPVLTDEFDFGTLDFDAFLRDSIDLENLGDTENIQHLDVAALYDIQDGVRHWAESAEHQHQADGQSNQHEQSSPWISSNSDDSSDVDMIDMAEEATASDDGMLVDDVDKVCYGMLYRQDVKLVPKRMEHLVESLKKLAGSRPDDVHWQKFKVTPNTAHILLTLPDETKFGFLRDNMTKPLESLLRKGPAIQVEAVGITQRLCKEIGNATKPEDALVHVDINIYGPQSLRDEVGAVLSGHKLWLQRPDWSRPQYPYSNQSNPHMIIFPDVHEDLVEEEIQKEISPASKPRSAKTKLDKFMEEVHISAGDKENGLENETGDQRLKTPLLMCVNPKNFGKTAHLLRIHRHQQQALSFMLQRESGDIPEQRRLWEKTTKNGQEMFIHRITKTSSRVQVEEMGGGVLSDEMGMGKSLCILALIVQTLDASHAWADQRKNDGHTSSKIRRHSHSSLIIVPSALLINHWLKEIRDHTGDALKTLKYHGPGRERELGALEQSDVVITTYNTLAAEAAAKKSQLHKINWYRVVLDEGHIIRRQATTLYRNCADLEARSRWCLTGTPIQNRLEDIGALFAFLRAEPFHSIAQFRRFICVPYEEDKPIAKERLILLYRSLCLRRTKDILTLPGCDEQTRPLELTDSEKRQYEKTTSILKRYMGTQEHRAGGAGYARYHSLQPWKKTQFGLFQAHLQLRILCNHGTFQKPFSWNKRDMKDAKTAEREAFISELGAGSELLCDGCKAFRPIIGLAAGAQHDFASDCPHSFCLDCLEDVRGLPGLENMRTCPLCLRNGNIRADDATDAVMQDADRKESTDKDMHDDAYFNQVGYSTKMEALVEDVKKDIVESKSIIFSCWTRTLDLIAKTLQKEQIEFDRIDGKCLLSERQRIIDRFAAKDSAPVLLMTTGTGAFGLNLTAANRIFIVEPQWNPSVENQAIARAIRLRQEKKVQVTRYFIKDTIEEQMMSQQVKKRQVASFGVVREDGIGAAQEAQEEDAHS